MAPVFPSCFANQPSHPAATPLPLRGRVQQVTGATHEMQRRAGNILPPAANDYSNNNTSSWAKPISKSTTNDPPSSMKVSPPNSLKVSPPNSSSGRSAALPAAASWGTRASNSQPLAASALSSNGPSKQKVDTSTILSVSTAPVSPPHASEMLKKSSGESPTANGKGKLEQTESENQVMGTDHHKTPCEIPATDNDLDVSDEVKVHHLASDMSSLSIGTRHSPQPCDDEKHPKVFPSNQANKAADPTVDDYVTEHSWNKVQEVSISEVEADLLSFNDQRLRDPEVTNTHTHTGYAQNMPQVSLY